MRISDGRSDVCSSDLLGGENHGWLNAKHHFSFANYQDPDRMNWGSLRVWNDDIIAPHTRTAARAPPHPHHDTCTPPHRSDERRVGNESVRTGRSRWATYHAKK